MALEVLSGMGGLKFVLPYSLLVIATCVIRAMHFTSVKVTWSSSFAHAWLRFLGFRFGLSFIQENWIFLNTHYLSALFFGVFALSQC